MKVERITEEVIFQPIKVELTVESRTELIEVMDDLGNLPSDGPLGLLYDLLEELTDES